MAEPLPPATTRRNRPYAPRLAPEERREQLLDTVLDVIDTDGVGAVSIDSVARRAGVTRPVVYKNFTDANDMLRACLAREEERAMAQIRDALPGPGHRDRAEAFHELFDAFLHAVTDAPQRWRSVFLISDSSTPTFQRRVARVRDRIIAEFESALAQACTGDADVDKTLLAHHLLASLFESGRLLLTDPATFPHGRLLRSLDSVFDAVTVAPEAR